jgi:hypothetical protein
LNKPTDVTSAGGIWFVGSCLNPHLFYVKATWKSGTIRSCIYSFVPTLKTFQIASHFLL